MRKIYALVVLLFISLCSVKAQISVTVTGSANTTPNLAASYPSLSLALTDLNAVTAMSGPVVLTCAAGGSETAPVKGFVIGSATLNPVLSATNTITLAKSGGTVTINAAVGTSAGPTATPDGMLYLNGADYVTIDGLTFTDGNSASATVAMEFGIAFFKRAAGDGCNNNTVQNCTFNMQRINNTAGTTPMLDGSNAIEILNSTATAATTSLTPTNGGTLATNGTNSGNKFYSNTINGGNIGIGFGGYAATAGVGPTPTATTFLGDLGNDVGGNSLATGNSILNFGGGAATNPAAGIRANNQWGINISYNNINNNDGGGVNHATTLRGIYAQAGTSANITINNNTISLKCAATTSASSAIDNTIGSTALSNTVTITGNIIQNCTYTTATSGTFTGILNASTATNVNINSNQVINNNCGQAATVGTAVFQGIYSSGSPTNFTANNNTISGNSILNNSGTFYGIRGSTSTMSYDGNTISNISIPNNTLAVSSSVYAIYNASSPAIETYTNNNINNLTISGNGTATANVMYGIYLNTASGVKTFSGNNINNISFTSSGTGYSTVAGIRDNYASTANIFKNVIHNLTSTGATPVVAGIYFGSTTFTTANIYNNIVGNLFAPASTGHNLFGIWCGSVGTTYNISFNTVYLNATSSASGSASSAVFMSSTTPTVNLINNILVNLSTGTTSWLSTAIRRTSATLTAYGAASNNNLLYCGTPSATNAIYYDGTNTDQTIVAFKVRVASRESASVTEPVSSSPGVFFQSLTGPASGTVTTFLHLVNGLSTQCESGGIPVSGITDDYDGNARNASTPDIGADEFNGVVLDLTPPVISAIVLSGNACNLTGRGVTATISDAGGVDNGSYKPRIYFRKNGGSYSSSAGSLSAGTVQNGTWSFTINYALLGGVVTTDAIEYFIVAQDIAPSKNVSGNPSGGLVLSDVNTVTTPPTTPLAFNVQSSISGVINVGTGEPAPYNTLTSAINQYNNSCLSGPVTFILTDASYDINETFPISINANADASATKSLTIVPGGSAVSVIGGNTTALFNLNGAKSVVFDGLNTGGSSLLIRNTASGPAFRFINDAVSNSIKNTTIESANTSSTSGTIFFSTSTGTLGNSNNTVSSCSVRDRSDAAGVPANAIYSLGSVGAPNGGNTISGCNIFSWTNAGVLVASTGVGNAWVINLNSFYQLASRTTALTGISLQGGSGHSIVSNSIGGTAPNAGGTQLMTSTTFRGIDLSVGTSSATSVQGNTVKNIRSTYSGGFTASYGIYFQAGMANIGNIAGNVVGSANVAERIEVSGDSYGINVASASTVNLSNNIVSNFMTAAGVPTGEYYYGIGVSGSGSHTVANNTVMNIANGSVPDASFNTQTTGMNISATGVQTIRGNIIHDIGNTSTSAPTANNNRIWGMIVSGTAVGTVVEGNSIYNIYGSSSGSAARADVITLLQSQTIANGTYKNNIIIGSDLSASDRFIYGILDLSASPAISNYYNNSVNIIGTATGANSTYAFNRNSTATVSIKNNIFVNTRSGGTGYHVAIANTNAAATGWAAGASDYNNLYSSTPSTTAQWLGALAGNNQTFAAWQAAQTSGSGGDANSLNVDPMFVSLTDLHLQTGSPMNAAATPVAGVIIDYDGQPRDGTTPDIGADEISASGFPGLWTGNVSTNYDVAGNWDDNTVPGPIGNVVVPVGVTNMPMLSTDKTISNIELRTGTTLSLNGKTYTINGTLSGEGTVTGGGLSSLVIGGSGAFGTLNMTQTTDGSSNVLSNLTLNRITSGAATLGNKLVITGVYTPTAGILTTGGFLHLRSTASSTARIAAGTGTYISGNVTVERYIPASGKRAWRLLGANVTAASAPTINAAWQEGGAASSMGTHITMIGGVGVNGFDASSIANNNQSLYAWNGTSLTTPANTNVTKVTDNGGAYFLFVRGDRNINLNNASSSSNTTLRMTGTVNQGNVTAGVAGASFSLIPNPYPSPVDYEAIIAANAGLTGVYYIWDANIGSVGAYRVVVRTGAGTYEQTPYLGSTIPDNTARYIRSGQAFFIPGNMQVNFTEAMKTDLLPGINVYRPGTGTEEMTINLNVVDAGGTALLYDGVRAKYNNSFSASVDNNDAPKLNNFTENLAIVRNNKTLAVETRPLVDAADTIFLKLWNTGIKNYQFEINPSNFSTTANLSAYLVDSYLQTTSPVSLSASTLYDFSITSNTASAAADRFMIVFRPSTTLPANFTNVKAYQKNSGIQVEWNVGSEVDVVKYEVEKSTNGTSFDKAGTVTANSSKAYGWFDATPNNGANFYRIKVINKDNTFSYSNVVNVKLGNTGGDIAVYPNPVKGNVINVQLTNLEKGTYNVQLVNSLGQQVYSGKIVHNGGSSSEVLQLSSALSKGVYQLVVSNGSTKQTIQVIAE